jgi:hypothetical protein
MIEATHAAVILRSRALARRLEGSPRALVVHPSRLAVKNGEHLRMTAVLVRPESGAPAGRTVIASAAKQSRAASTDGIASSQVLLAMTAVTP